MSDRRQRQKELRAAKREAERKRASRRELGRRLLTALVFGVIVISILGVTGVFGGDDGSEVPGTYEDYRAQETACDAERPPPEQIMSFDGPEPQPDVSASVEATATIVTSCGEIIIDLNTADAVQTVNSFVFLAREGFYDGQVIHRIAVDFAFQAGDPRADGTGGPGYLVPDEFPDDDFVYEEGVVAMWSRGARSTGSQFMVISGSDGEFLTNQFNVLGRVVSGQDAIDRIMAVPTATAPGTVERSRPLETVYIESIDIEVVGS